MVIIVAICCHMLDFCPKDCNSIQTSNISAHHVASFCNEEKFVQLLANPILSSLFGSIVMRIVISATYRSLVFTNIDSSVTET